MTKAQPWTPEQTAHEIIARLDRLTSAAFNREVAASSIERCRWNQVTEAQYREALKMRQDAERLWADERDALTTIAHYVGTGLSTKR